MNDAGLVIELMWLEEGVYPAPDPRPVVGVLEELLRRNLPEEEARKLRFQLGYGYRALKEHGKEEALFRELARTLPPDTDDRIQPQQFDGDSWVIEIDLAGRQRLDHSPR